MTFVKQVTRCHAVQVLAVPSHPPHAACVHKPRAILRLTAMEFDFYRCLAGFPAVLGRLLGDDSAKHSVQGLICAC
jgi:hypothetical protein